MEVIEGFEVIDGLEVNEGFDLPDCLDAIEGGSTIFSSSIPRDGAFDNSVLD